MRALAVVAFAAKVAAIAIVAAGCGRHDAATAPTPAPKPGSGSWRTGVALPNFLFEGAAAVANGKLHYLGGITGIEGDARTVAQSRKVFVFDRATQAWTDGPPLPDDAPAHHLAVASLEDRIYVMGGFTGVVGGEPPGTFTPQATSYVLDGGAWRKIAPQPFARGAATAQAIGGLIYVAGGGDDENAARDDLLAYDPATDTWTARAPMPTAREHVASCVSKGKLVVAGGWSGAAKATLTAAEVYDPASDTWSALPTLPSTRGGLGGIGVADECYFIGGERWDIPPPATSSAVEAIASDNATWVSLAPMPTARHGIGVAQLAGEIYVVGGGPSQGNSYTNVVEIFHP